MKITEKIFIVIKDETGIVEGQMRRGGRIPTTAMWCRVVAAKLLRESGMNVSQIAVVFNATSATINNHIHAYETMYNTKTAFAQIADAINERMKM